MDLAELVGGAASGDRAAWERIVERFSGLVWAVVRSHRLGDADAADAFQTTWLRLVEHLGELREPDRLGSWLATTARRECLRTLRAGRRLVPVEDAGADLVADVPDPDRALMAALAEVSERCRRLLRLLMADPAPSYREVGAALDMPIGSIGPTRERCLARLREGLAARGITADP